MIKKILLKNGRLFDGKSSHTTDNMDIMIEDDTIIAVGRSLQADRCRVVDITGKTVMPGLINAHTHIIMTPTADPLAALREQTEARLTVTAIDNLKKLLDSGVTYFRDAGSLNYIDLSLRDCVRSGMVEGPEFIAAGKCLCMTGGHGHFFGKEVDGADDARRGCREQLKAGVDVIKFMATGGVMTPGVEPGSPQLTFMEIEAIIEEAKKAGRKTFTHAQGATGIKNAVRAGVDSVEHGLFLDDEAVDLMLKNDACLVPTITAPYFIIKNGVKSGIPAFAVKKAENAGTAHKESFQKALAAGVKIACGTDSGTPFNLFDSTPLEIKLMVDYGMNQVEALKSATSVAAELLGISDRYGDISVGKQADILILNDDPVEKISTLFEIAQVYKSGRRVVRKTTQSIRE